VCVFNVETCAFAELPFVAGSATQTCYFETANVLLIRTSDCARLVSLSSLATTQLAVRTRLPPGAVAPEASRDAAVLSGDIGYLWFGCSRGFVRWCALEDHMMPLVLLGSCADLAASPLFFLFRRGRGRLCAPVFPQSSAHAGKVNEEPPVEVEEPFAARLAQLEATARRLARALSALSSGVDEDGAELRGAVAWDELWVPPEMPIRTAAAINERWYVLAAEAGHLWIVSPYDCKAVCVPESRQRKPGREFRVLLGADGLLVIRHGTRVHITRLAHVRAALEAAESPAPELRCRRLLLPGGARAVTLAQPHFLVAEMQNRVAVWDLTSVAPPCVMDLSKQ
jgi:hypothetical protein